MFKLFLTIFVSILFLIPVSTKADPRTIEKIECKANSIEWNGGFFSGFWEDVNWVCSERFYPEGDYVVIPTINFRFTGTCPDGSEPVVRWYLSFLPGYDFYGCSDGSVWWMEYKDDKNLSNLGGDVDEME